MIETKIFQYYSKTLMYKLRDFNKKKINKKIILLNSIMIHKSESNIWNS